MVMNNKGQIMILKIMLAVVFLIFAMIFIIPVKEAVQSNTNTTSLNCTSSALSYSEVATCNVLDISWFYFIGSILVGGLGFITGNKNKGMAVISSITIFIIIAVMINPLKELIVAARSADFLNCAATDLSLGNQMLCILFDAWLFWFLAIIISVGISYIFTKKVLNEQL